MLLVKESAFQMAWEWKQPEELPMALEQDSLFAGIGSKLSPSLRWQQRPKRLLPATLR
jgi:hypothetical protein